HSTCAGRLVMPVTDLWPDFQAPEAINSPAFLLKEQAAKLQQKNKGPVLAGLRPASAPDGSFWVGFDLYSPALGEYTYRLFEVTYPRSSSRSQSLMRGNPKRRIPCRHSRALWNRSCIRTGPSKS